MQTLIRLAIIIFITVITNACASQHSIRKAAQRVESGWKAENEQILKEEGQRRFKATKRQGFEAAQSAAMRLGMIIENQTYESGFIFMSAPAPSPLTVPEWERVQAAETQAMRNLVSNDLGLYQWWVTLDPSGKDVLANVIVAEKADGIAVSLGLRLRVKDSTTDRLKRMQPPPTALRMGLAKFWAAYEMELEAMASNANPAIQKPAKKEAVTRPENNSPRAATVHRTINPDAVAVIIGNRNYTDEVPPVDFAHQDAAAWRTFAIEQLGVSERNIIDLRDATLPEMEGVLGNARSHTGKLWRWTRPHESDLYVFYSGHGVPGTKDRRAYLLPVGCNPDMVELDGYPLDLLYENLSKMEARTTTVFIEACFSGQSPGGQLLRGASGIRVAAKTPPADTLTIVTAAHADQMASWNWEAEHGLFTQHLLQALGGAADRNRYGREDGTITLGEIRHYLDREMSYAARRNYGRTQQAMVFGDPEQVLLHLPAK